MFSKLLKKIQRSLLIILYHTIPTFNDPEKEAFWKHCAKRKKCWLQPAFSVSHNVFYPSHITVQFFIHTWTSLKFCHLIELIQSFELYKIRSFANGYNFGTTTTLLGGVESILYNTIPTFNHPEKVGFWKFCEKRRKCLYSVFFLLPEWFVPYQR